MQESSKFHPFHIVQPSPWPILCSFSAFTLAIGLICWMNKSGEVATLLLINASAIVSVIVAQWWRDVVREGTFLGSHTLEVCSGLYIGFSMFILSEVMFFFSFFFSYFFSSLSPDFSVGSSWPPIGVQPVSFSGIPLSNTIVLLSSGVSVTWAHHSLLSGEKSQFTRSMLTTTVLGMLFMALQFSEYFEISFTFADSIYGSLFFIMTGFHGAHVLLGGVFLLVSFLRGMKGHLSTCHHLGFEFSAWYWHFVDVVWLFLFLVVYWWGS